MSLAALAEDVAYTRLHFQEGIIRFGFVERHGGWHGLLAHPSGSTEIRVELPPSFPFKPPTVTPVESDAVPWSWHRDLNGSLCLVAEDDHQDLWWVEAEMFLAHVTAWFESSDAGWRDDRPDLDLDRYFQPDNDERLYLYGELDGLVDKWVRFRPGPNNTMRLAGIGTPPKKRTKHSNNVFGYVARLGHIDAPPRGWDDLVPGLDEATILQRRIQEGKLGVLVVQYHRGQHLGAILLHVTPTSSDEIAVNRLSSAADTLAARAARAGPKSQELRGRTVAVLGLGAVGSFTADMLVRAGVTRLTLVDHDVVKPGNLVRHLVGPSSIGMPKVDAVRTHLRQHHGTDLQIDPREESLNPDSVVVLVREHDLVINATADFSVTAMVHAAAAATNRHALSAAIQNDGDTFRIDVLPPLDGAAPLPNSALGGPSSQDYFEAGCGSPISPTPPHAVIEAASATVRHAVGLLTGTPITRSGEVGQLVPTEGGALE